MGRSHITTTLQPDNISCGPASIKHALEILGKRKSVSSLAKLCKTTKNGTGDKKIIRAFNTLGFSVLTIERATLRHLITSLRYQPSRPRAVMVNYLYSLENNEDEPWYESGHWATVSSFSAADNKIILFDSYTGTKKSYRWHDFRKRWMDYDIKRKKTSARSKKLKTYRKWCKQFLLVVSSDPSHLPKFRYATTHLHPGVN